MLRGVDGCQDVIGLLRHTAVQFSAVQPLEDETVSSGIMESLGCQQAPVACR